tara:strand:+ start:1094 stop:1630 length:537 start_codon:yes stop_codon:yes gene_type:complete
MKLFDHFFNKLITRKTKNRKEHEEKLEREMKAYWAHVDKNLDTPLEQYLWNNDCSPENYKKTDFIELVNERIKEHLEKIYKNNEVRRETDLQNIKLNILFLTVYSYATTMKLVDGFIFFFALLLLSLFICHLWHHTLKNSLMLNAASFAIIRRLQRFLPIKSHGDAEFKLITSVRPKK